MVYVVTDSKKQQLENLLSGNGVTLERKRTAATSSGGGGCEAYYGTVLEPTGSPAAIKASLVPIGDRDAEPFIGVVQPALMAWRGSLPYGFPLLALGKTVTVTTGEDP